MKSIDKVSKVVAGLMMIGSGIAHASSEVTAVVTSVGTYGNGNIYIALNKSVDEPGCPSQYLEFPPSGAVTKSLMAAASIALTTGGTVTVKTDACFNGQPSFSGARTGYFVVNKL